MNIDLHAHVLGEETMRLMRGINSAHAPRIEKTDDGPMLVVGDVRYPNSPVGTWDLEVRLAEMDRTGVDAQAVAVVPFTFGYLLEAQLNLELCQAQNEQLAALHRQYPSRFYPLGCVPLQDPSLAVAEAERAVRQLGLFGLGLGTRLADRNLDWSELEPFWSKV